jgi:hypothetical protein
MKTAPKGSRTGFVRSGSEFSFEFLSNFYGQVDVFFGIADKNVKVFLFKVAFWEKKVPEKFVMIKPNSNRLADERDDDDGSEDGGGHRQNSDDDVQVMDVAKVFNDVFLGGFVANLVSKF